MKKKYSYITALIRYKIIDDCLSNTTKMFTKHEMIDLIKQTFKTYNYDKGLVSQKTIETDYLDLKSNKYGYNAPIIIKKHKYYTYGDKNYTIKKLPVPITKDIYKMVKNAVYFAKYYRDFNFFDFDNFTVIKSQKTNNNSIIINALIRYTIIDDCLKDQTKKYSIISIQKVCLTELKKHYKNIKVDYRTIVRDLGFLASTKYGYNAPIEKKDNFYRYSDPTYTIKNLPIPISDINIINIKKSLIFADIYKKFKTLKF